MHFIYFAAEPLKSSYFIQLSNNSSLEWCYTSVLLYCTEDLETITTRQNVVAELTDNEEMFHRLRSVLGRFLDLNHLLSTCVQIPKQETVKTADRLMTTIVYLKHTLEEIGNLRAAIADSENELLKAFTGVDIGESWCFIVL